MLTAAMVPSAIGTLMRIALNDDNRRWWTLAAMCFALFIAAGSKTPLFRAPITVVENADWLVTVLPDSVAPNDVKVLVVASDDPNPATEVPNTL